jgi:hypothetical protein
VQFDVAAIDTAAEHDEEKPHHQPPAPKTAASWLNPLLARADTNSHDLAANRLPALGSELQRNHRGLLR